MKGLKGKVAVVTGATSGIGEATALALADAGVNLILTGRNEEKGKRVRSLAEARNVKAIFRKADIKIESDVRGVFEEVKSVFGHLDFALNNAGVESEGCPLESFDSRQYESVMETNVLGTMLSMKFEIPLMRMAGRGSIVNVSSIAGLIGFPNFSIYVASKHAVLGLTKSAALELASENIRVNAVSPGAVQTSMLDRWVDNDERKKASFAKMHPLGRVGSPDEIASTVLFLMSEDAAFITGQSLAVDGGYTVS